MAFLIEAPVYGTIGVIKGVICTVPCTVYSTLATSCISLYRLLPNTYLTYKALWKTEQIGPTLKVVLTIIAPVPIVLTPPIVAIGTCLATALYSLFGPIVSTIADGMGDSRNEQSLCSMSSVFTTCFYDIPKRYAKAMSQGYPELIAAFEDRKLEKGERPYDVPIQWIPVGLFYAVSGGILNGLANLVMSVIKVLPLVKQMYGFILEVYWQMPFEIKFWTFLPFILSLIATPCIAVAAAIVFPLAGIILGLGAAGAAYNRGFKAGFHRIAHTIYDCDIFSNMIAFKKKSSWVPCLKLGEDLF